MFLLAPSLSLACVTLVCVALHNYDTFAAGSVFTHFKPIGARPPVNLVQHNPFETLASLCCICISINFTLLTCSLPHLHSDPLTQPPTYSPTHPHTHTHTHTHPRTHPRTLTNRLQARHRLPEHAQPHLRRRRLRRMGPQVSRT